jgi:hypothetical protein
VRKRVQLLVLFWSVLIWALPLTAGVSVRCTTYKEKTLHRLHTVCDDGTRAVSTYNQLLDRWDTRMTVPPWGLRDQRRPQPKAPRR